MSKDKFLPDIDAYFANTPLEHMQNVYDDVKDFEQYGPDVKEYLCSNEKAFSSRKKVEVAASNVALNSKSEIQLPQFVM